MCHDCVVVPGLGSFMTNDEPARYDSVNQEFIPPRRSIGFNPEVRHNDAMLAGSISRLLKVSYEAARSRIDTEVSSLRYQLQLSGEVPFGRLGMLFRGENPEFPVFEPSSDSLPARRYDGLRPLAITPLKVETEEETEERVAQAHHVVTIPLPLKIVASVIVVMVALGILYSTTSLVNGPCMNFASLDTGLSSTMEPAASVEASITDVVSRDILLNIAIPDEKQSVNESYSPEVVKKTGRYILVVASYPSKRAAERHIQAIGDSSLNIMEMDGNYRVYAASASDINSARKLADSLSGRYPTVWVCRR